MQETTYKTASLPCSFALLGDFHNGDPVPVLSSLRSHHPSFICIAGDIFYYRDTAEGILMIHNQKNVLPLLTGCVSIAPTFLSLGNHDRRVTEEDLFIIKELGVTVLDDEWTTTIVSNKKISIGGLTSHHVKNRRAMIKTFPDFDSLDEQEQQKIRSEWTFITQPDYNWLRTVPENDYAILLSHHPEYFPNIPHSIDLILAAHAHGGQWRVFKHGLFAPGQGFWPKYTKGIYTHPNGEKGQMIVTAGLTNTTRVPRIFNPTELVYISGPVPSPSTIALQ